MEWENFRIIMSGGSATAPDGIEYTRASLVKAGLDLCDPEYIGSLIYDGRTATLTGHIDAMTGQAYRNIFEGDQNG